MCSGMCFDVRSVVKCDYTFFFKQTHSGSGLLTCFFQLVLDKLDFFSVLSHLKPDINSFYNPQYHVHLVDNWRLLESVSSNTSGFCLFSALATSGQIFSWLLNSKQNAKQLP